MTTRLLDPPAPPALPPPGEHIAGLYRHEGALIAQAVAFLSPRDDPPRPARRKRSVRIAIVAPEHLAPLRRGLDEAGADVARLERTGRLVFHDARTVLADLLACDGPDRATEHLDALLGPQATGVTRVFSGLGTLWAGCGQPDAPVWIERAWNALLARRSFALLCACPLSGRPGDGAALASLCCQHSVVRSPPADRSAEIEQLAELQRRLAEQEAIEAEVAASQRDLLHARTMEAVGRLAGSIAHDFNNLLTVVRANTEALARRPELRSNPSLADIVDATRMAASLTRQLQALSGNQILRPCRVDPGAVARAVRDQLALVAGDALTLTLDLSEPCGEVLADPSQLERAVFNLLVNAREATGGRGRVEIRTQKIEVSGTEPRWIGMPSGRYAAIVVADDGPGIAPEILDRLFEPFVTTKQHAMGVGMGLATAFGIVRQSGGRIFAESAPGAGATFTVLLPLAPPAVPEEAPAAETEAPLLRLVHATRLLLVEREPLVRATIAVDLRRAGLLVAEAGDAAAALALASEVRFDLLVMDEAVPGSAALAERIRLGRPDLGVVVISGGPSPSNQPVTGRTVLLAKPFGMPTLMRAVEDLLARDHAVRRSWPQR